MAAGDSLPIRGTSGKVSVTVGATTTQGYFVGSWEVGVEKKTEEAGPWVGNSTITDVATGKKFTFKCSGEVSPTGEDTDSDTWFAAFLAAYTTDTSPDVLIFDAIKGKKFSFAAATTTYSKCTYKQDAKGTVSFEAEGSGIPTIAAGSAS